MEDNEDFIVIASRKAKVTETNGRCWFTHEPAVTIFSKKEWWNVICMFKNDGICYYCNIASPAILSKESIVYIDYDLDAKLFPDKSIKILDEKEYGKHMKRYGYSDELDKVLNYQTEEIVKKMKEGTFPFADSNIENYYAIYKEKTFKKHGI